MKQKRKRVDEISPAPPTPGDKMTDPKKLSETDNLKLRLARSEALLAQSQAQQAQAIFQQKQTQYTNFITQIFETYQLNASDQIAEDGTVISSL